MSAGKEKPGSGEVRQQIQNQLQSQKQRAGAPAPHKGLRWLALGVLVTNGHCGCTKVTNIIFEHHPYQRGTNGISACLRPALN